MSVEVHLSSSSGDTRRTSTSAMHNGWASAPCFYNLSLVDVVRRVPVFPSIMRFRQVFWPTYNCSIGHILIRIVQSISLLAERLRQGLRDSADKHEEVCTYQLAYNYTNGCSLGKSCHLHTAAIPDTSNYPSLQFALWLTPFHSIPRSKHKTRQEHEQDLQGSQADGPCPSPQWTDDIDGSTSRLINFLILLGWVVTTSSHWAEKGTNPSLVQRLLRQCWCTDTYC